jgi:hypothetical protein
VTDKKRCYTSLGLDNGGDDLRKPLTSPGSKCAQEPVGRMGQPEEIAAAVV